MDGNQTGPSGTPDPRAGNTTCRALVVDDDKLVRDFLITLLKGLGADVVGEAENGRDAVAAYADCDPDVVFLDIQMPVMDGKAALREIIAADPDAYVVMLSSVNDMDTADACVDAGGRNFIRKQAESNILRSMVKFHVTAVASP